MWSRFRPHARRRALVAGLIGVLAIVVLGPLVLLPALALVAFVYYAHQVAAVAAGDATVPNPDLALVIVLNALSVLIVQGILFAASIGAV